MKAPACRCGVKAFPTERDANAQYRRIWDRNVSNSKPTGVDRCSYGMWHLTYPRKDTGPSAKLRALVEARDKACVRCGAVVPRDEDSIHHRIPRGRGGENTAENLLLLCGSGVTGCHGWVESHRTEAYNAGYLVRTGFDPLDVPVLLLGTTWAYPSPDGQWVISGGTPADLIHP